MNVTICENEFSREIPELVPVIKTVAEETLRSDRVDGALNILLVDDEEILRLNTEFRGIERVTDVLSFPENELPCPIAKLDQTDCLERDPDTGEYLLGDIAICLKRAREQADEYGHSLKRELSFLTAHGSLHLMGYDHMQPDEERIMFEKQESILATLEINR